jgi:hypothetical protein
MLPQWGRGLIDCLLAGGAKNKNKIKNTIEADDGSPRRFFSGAQFA